jgi:hypothetical protein
VVLLTEPLVDHVNRADAVELGFAGMLLRATQTLLWRAMVNSDPSGWWARRWWPA